MLRLRFAPLSMTGDDAPVVMLSEAKHLIPLYCRVLRTRTNATKTPKKLTTKQEDERCHLSM